MYTTRIYVLFNNSNFIDDRSDHWSFLLFKELLAIPRFKPELNHGTIRPLRLNNIQLTL